MSSALESLLGELRAKFGDAIGTADEFRCDVTLTVQREKLADVALFLRDNPDLPFPMCEDVCGVDRYERKERFEVVYHFYSTVGKVRIAVKVKVEATVEECVVPSITAIYPGAAWLERETYDMYGIRFSGHPDLRRIYMPEDYEYYPLRKDFPLMGIPGSIPLPKR